MVARLVSIISVRCELGECPVWDERGGCLWWTDIQSRVLYRWNQIADRVDSFRAPERIGSFGLTEEPDGLICAFESGFWRFEPESGTCDRLGLTGRGREGCRMNDGRVDRSGYFWAGSMVEVDSAPGGRGALYRYDGNGRFSIHLDEITIANGICWSPDGGLMYFTDSPTGRIQRYEMSASGLSDGIDFAAGLQGAHPDGAVVDAEGCVWSAQWGRAAVLRLSPGGELEAVLGVPCPQPTCVAFGGPDHRTLFVTTARTGLSQSQLAEYPDSGAVFVYETDIQGIAEPICTVL
jgi:sugar lactone lactonase YvrE